MHKGAPEKIGMLMLDVFKGYLNKKLEPNQFLKHRPSGHTWGHDFITVDVKML